MKKRTIVIDFDGTLVDHVFPGVGRPKKGAVEAIKKLANFYNIVISSCRNNPDIKARHPTALEDIHNFLKEHEIENCVVDCGTKGKVVASAYIDDRGIRFENNWQELAEMLTDQNLAF